MQHLDEGTIHAWLDGALPQDESARAELHAASCAECAALVAEARGMIAGASRIVSALDSVPAGVVPRGAPSASPGSLWRTLRVTPARAAFAATLLLAVGSMLAVRHDTPGAPKLVMRVMPAADRASVDSIVAKPTAPQVPARGTITPALRATASAHTAAPAATPAPRPQPASAAPAPSPPAVTADKPAVAVADAPRDSAQRKAAADERAQARSVAGGVAREQSGFNAAPRAMQLQSVVTTSLAARTQAYSGCYVVTKDSTGWPRSIPNRFALDSAGVPAAPGQHVVRAIGPTGRVDSVLTAATWREVGPGYAMIAFSLPEGRRVVTLDMSPHGTLTRMSCVVP